MSELPITVLSPPTLESLQRGEIDVQIKTAKEYPRNLSDCLERAIDAATLDEETAAACLYALPREGRTIEGGSIRLAEIIASTWTNLRVAARPIGEDGRHITAMAVCHDLENNLAVAIEKRRRITDRKGRRYSDDMVTTTVNAAVSIAMRDAIFRVVPRALWMKVQRAARQVAIGKTETLQARRGKVIDYFAKMGIFKDRLLAHYGYTSIEEIGLDQLAELRGLATAIKEGDITVDEAFPEISKQTMTTATETLTKRLEEHKSENKIEQKRKRGRPRKKVDSTKAREAINMFHRLSEEDRTRIKGNFGIKIIGEITEWTDATTLNDMMIAMQELSPVAVE